MALDLRLSIWLGVEPPLMLALFGVVIWVIEFEFELLKAPGELLEYCAGWIIGLPLWFNERFKAEGAEVAPPPSELDDAGVGNEGIFCNHSSTKFCDLKIESKMFYYNH